MIAEMPASFFFPFLGIFLAMVGVCVYVGGRALRQAAFVRATPATSIALAQPGYVKLIGVAEAGPEGLLEAPLTRQPCVWYEGRLERSEWSSGSSGSRSQSWVLEPDFESGEPLICRDATGTCLIEPLRAEVFPAVQSLWYGQSRTPKDRNPPELGPTDPLTGMVNIAGSNKYKYIEKRIRAGDPLLVLGELRRADDKNGRSALVLSRGSGVKPLLITTQSEASHLALSTTGGKTAFGVALLPLAISAALIWARYW